MKISKKFNRAVFFDRDGIINKLIDGNSPRITKDIILIEGIDVLVKSVREKGFFTIIISNQPDISLRKINENTRIALEKQFETLFKKHDIIFDSIYYCYHHENGTNLKYPKQCDCRKPKPGLLLKAAKKHHIDLNRSYFIGDRAMDVKAGFLAGTKTILFDNDNAQKAHLELHQVQPNFTIANLLDAKKIIV